MKTFTISILALATSFSFVIAAPSQKLHRAALTLRTNTVVKFFAADILSNPTDGYEQIVTYSDQSQPIDSSKTTFKVTYVNYNSEAVKCQFYGDNDKDPLTQLSTHDNGYTFLLDNPQALFLVQCTCLDTTSC